MTENTLFIYHFLLATCSNHVSTMHHFQDITTCLVHRTSFECIMKVIIIMHVWFSIHLGANSRQWVASSNRPIWNLQRHKIAEVTFSVKQENWPWHYLTDHVWLTTTAIMSRIISDILPHVYQLAAWLSGNSVVEVNVEHGQYWNGNQATVIPPWIG